MRPPLGLRLLVALAALAGLLAPPAEAAWLPDGVDLTRPRILHFPNGVAAVQERLDREPYLTFLRDMERRIRIGERVALDDHVVESGRFKARAAKDLAFLYAIERRLVDGVAVPFADPAQRRAAGDRVRELLVNLYDRSRLAVRPPLGNWDRDISTSEELMQYATAYDTMLGAGYDFGADDAMIREKLVNLASELYLNYTVPETAGSSANLHQNNHRSKTGASLVVAGVVLAEHTPAPGDDPDGVRDPADWIAYGLVQLDSVLRWVLVAPDGAYGEGPFYMRFTQQNLLPFARAWDRLVDGAPVEALGVEIPSWWRHPLFRRGLHWLLDMTLPDGSLAAIDDGNVFRTHYYGLWPQDHPLADAFAWHWAGGAQPWETDGNIDLAPDALVYFDDTAVAPAPRGGSPTAFYPEGGTAIFRSGWSRDAVMAVVTAESEIASEFGRDRDGIGVSPQSHEHAEPGAFLLHAFGERLALDPGYFTFPARFQVNRPQHHNMILVDGAGPVDYFGASFVWPVFGLDGRPPADGMATLSHPLDTGFLDAARATMRYGGPVGAVQAGLPRLERRYWFADDRYLVLADRGADPQDTERTWTWLLHGNGGGTSGGSFERVGAGGRWEIGGARLDGGFAFDVGPAALATSLAIHEDEGKEARTHVTLEASAVGAAVRSIGVVYPSRAGEAAPALVELELGAAAGLGLTDTAGDRRLVAAHRSRPGAAWRLPGDATGLRDATTDGSAVLVDGALDGTLRLAWAEDARWLEYGGVVHLEAITPGRLGLRLDAARAELVALNADPALAVRGLPFVPARADGACALAVRDGVPWIELGRERRVVLHAATGNARPAADPGPDRAAPSGSWLALDGRASCDADGDVLAPRWELVAAPPGSSWRLDDADTWNPKLEVDRPGPYRVRLVVTDANGAASRPADVVVHGGPPCANRLDDDLDGLFDEDDPDCDVPAAPNRPPRADDDTYAMAAGETLEADSVLANDDDPDIGDARVAVLESPPARGSLWLRPDGRFRYEPAAGFAGIDAFRYRARDAAGAESAPARVEIEVRGPDVVSVFLVGGLSAFHHAPLESGDLEIERRPDGGVAAITGVGVLAGGSTSLEFSLAVSEPEPLAMADGTVTLRDPALGLQPVVVPIAGQPLAGLHPNGAVGWSGWIAQPPLQPYALLFAVHDRD